jgi:glutamine cyclotransferase
MMRKASSMIYAAIISLALVSCGEKTSKTTDNGAEEIKATPLIEVANVRDGQVFTEGESIAISFKLPTEANGADSTVVTFNDKKLPKANNASVTIATDGLKLGRQRIVIEAYKNGSLVAEKYLSVVLKSKLKPTLYTYKVEKIYPHDTRAYTQGLLFDGNTLYEGTGQRGISDIRITDLVTGQVVKSAPLPSEIFGEGIAIVGDKAYQLSWQDQRGFIYNKHTLEKIGEFTYAGEGWGLATDGKVLFHSDGTNAIRLVDPSSLTELSRIEVYDNTGAVEYLNELEYINGEIWANIYQTDKIARIDPSTGRVNGYVDLSNILPKNDYTETTDVLNGIAYHKASGKIYVTGKNWPKLFEIKVVKR